MHRVLITGGCGFVGTNLAKCLSAAGGYELTLLDNFSNAVLENGHACRVIRGDIRDGEICAKSAKGQDAVVHLAAYTQVVESLGNPAQCYAVNIQGTINLLEACRKHGVSRFAFASSNAAVGGQASAVSERTVATPMSPYGAAKLAGEALCSAYRHSYGICPVALRFSNAYGPYCQKKSSVVAKFMRALIDGKPLTIFGDGSQSRDFIHVADLCQAIELCLSSPTSSVAGEIFQVATGIEISVRGLIEVLARVTGRQPQLRFEPARTGEITKNSSDISKIRARLGFTPMIGLEEGIRSLCQWFQSSDVVSSAPPLAASRS